MLSFENKLCVYSSSVGQLYTNYNIFFPAEESRKLVILPNPYAHHDTFHNIRSDAIKPTGILICPPSDPDQKKGLTMVIPLKNDRSKFKRIPIAVGLHLIRMKRPENKPFLPVLTKGDLRELDQDTPCLHLHSIDMHELHAISDLEKRDIVRVVQDRIVSLTKHTPSTGSTS